MSRSRTCFALLLLVGTLWNCVLSLQRPPPRYSQQYMPDTSFNCRNKIVGSYYADPETDCQLFHVCVSVAGTIQDYRFLCPNDTAFDQESQTCADWYDVDCEAATLYYASDNFDLYRLGSGLESLHYDNIRSDVEPQDHLQRSESSDPIRSSANSLNRAASKGYDGNNDRDVLKGSGSNNFYNGRNNDKDDDYANEKVYRESAAQEARKKTAVRKVTRKQQYNGSTRYVGNDGNDNYQQSTTAASAVSNQNDNNYNTNGNYYNNNFNQRQSNFASSTTQRSTVQQENFNKNQNNQKYSTYSSTYRPTTNHREIYDTYQSPSTTARTTEYDNFNNNGYNTNQQSASNFNQSPSTTVRPTSYNTNSKNTNNLFNQQSTTVRPSTNYQSSEYTNHHQRNYNNIQRSSSSTAFQSTTAASTFYDNYGSSSNNNNNNNNNNGQYNNRGSSPTTTKQDSSQTTPKYLTNNFAGSSYIPTTYSPATKKFVNNDNGKAQSSTRSNNQYENNKSTSNGQYFDKSVQGSKSTQYYDSTKAPKKATQYNAYDNTNAGKYFDGNTENYNNYDFGKSSPSTGFSPASINHLAEGPTPTTPVPRTAAVNTYNPNTFNANTQRSPQSHTTPRGSTFVSGSARPFSTTSKPIEAKTAAKPKSGKKNDYDYAYYDNAGQLEYDSLDFEHTIGNKESSKISRN